MNPSRRSQLREVLRAQAHDQRWAALIERHGAPLLVLDPDRVAAQYRLLSHHLRGFRLHYAVKALPHPAVLATIAACAAASTSPPTARWTWCGHWAYQWTGASTPTR